MKSEAENWTTIIEPRVGILDINFKEIWQYRDLIKMFVRRDFVSVYKQTVLGPAWYVIRPLLTTVVFTIIFGNIAGLSTDGLPKMLFYLSGTVTWSYFSTCFLNTSNTFVQGRGLFGKVYFPRLVMPISRVISNLFGFGIQFLFFICFAGYYLLTGDAVDPNGWLLLTPLLIFLMAVFGLGMGIIISSMTTKYRDLQFLVQFGVQLLMYGTPVIYPLSMVPDKYRWLIKINPMTPIVESIRYGFLGKGMVTPGHLLYAAMVIFIIFFIGLLMFNKIEKKFMDTV